MTTDGTLDAGLDVEWVEAFEADYLAAWNSRDADQLLSLMAPGIVYDDSAWPSRMHGHDAVREFLHSTWTALPDLTFELVEGPYVAPGKPKAAFHWRATGTLTGPLVPPGYAPTGRRATFEGVDLHEYREHLLVGLRVDFDVMDLARQLGLLPTRGSLAERALARTQRAGMRVLRR
jgi:steroid delta-isomerase-like uncharacterized protein